LRAAIAAAKGEMLHLQRGDELLVRVSNWNQFATHTRWRFHSTANRLSRTLVASEVGD